MDSGLIIKESYIVNKAIDDILYHINRMRYKIVDLQRRITMFTSTIESQSEFKVNILAEVDYLHERFWLLVKNNAVSYTLSDKIIIQLEKIYDAVNWMNIE